MEEETNYRILAQTKDEFNIIEKGYKEFTKYFGISGNPCVLLQLGYGPQVEEGNIDISPISPSGKINGIMMDNNCLEYKIISAEEDRWIIWGKKYSYMVHAKKSEC
jgi:hypothetical protein